MLALQAIVYLCVALCVIGVAAKTYKYYNTPVHLRWELYPVAHEKGKAQYGGSYYEEYEWWKNKPEPSLMGELEGMVPEMLFIKALYEHNRPLWYRSFPFHFGLYMLIGFVGLLILGVILGLLGLGDGAIGSVVHKLMYVAAIPGMILVLIGSAGLLHRRMTDPDVADYTYFSHYFNLVFIFATVLVAFLAWLISDHGFAMLGGFVVGLLPFVDMPASIPFLVKLEVLLGALLIAYIPFTNMSHPIAKYFMYHQVKWQDEPNLPGGEIEKKLGEVLNYPVTWSAPHIRGDGKRTWAEIATEEWKKDEKQA